MFLVVAIISGGWVAESPTWAPFFDFTGVQLTWMLVGYGFVAAVLPVWLLLAPRDYLSTFLKIGTIVGLAIGILIMRPTLTMPALTKFIDGTGARSGPAICSRSCLSPSPVGQCLASMRLSPPGPRRRCWRMKIRPA